MKENHSSQMDLSDIFMMYPKCLSDKKLFKAILFDIFPEDKAYINLLLMCFDQGIINDISKSDKNIYELNKYIKKLCDFFGCKKVIAKRIVTDLFKAFGGLYKVGEYEVIELVDNGMITPEAYFKNTKIKKAIVPEGVKVIGREAFCDCYNLQEIVLPEGLERIENDAFSGCENLKRINIPQSVNSIGIHAFAKCTSLISIVLPEKLDKINEGVFLECDNLETVYISKLVTEIGDYAFCDCYSLRSVNIPDGVKRIGDYAFSECCSLNSIIVPDSVDVIGKKAFYCDEDGIDRISSLYNIRFLGDDAFPMDTRIEKITISQLFMDSMESMNDIFEKYYYPDVDILVIEEGVTKIPEGFFKSGRFNSIVLPDSLIEIGENAFKFSEVENICIPIGVEIIGDGAFWDCQFTELRLPGTIKKIGQRAFYGCTGLHRVYFEDGIEEIGDYIFDDCMNLQEVRLPSTLKRIAKNAFYCCHKLDDLDIPDGTIVCDGKYIDESGWDINGLYRVVDDILVDVDEEILEEEYDGELYIEKPIKGIAPDIIQNLEMLNSIKINNNFKSIDVEMFKNCKFYSIEFENEITDIGDRAFYGCKYLTDINMVEGLEIIGNKAFYKCWDLKKVEIPNSIKRIEKYAFVLSGLKIAYIPETVEYVDENAFEPEVRVIYCEI